MASIMQSKLNLVPGAAPGGILPRVRVSQNDSANRILQFELFDGNQEADLSGISTAFIGGLKPDGNGFTITCVITGNTATAALSVQSTVLSGDVPCKLYLIYDEGSVRSATFTLQVDPDPLNNADYSETEVPDIINLARTYKDEAAESASAAATSETNAAASATAAANSASAAATSEANASASETAAKTSEDNAKASETAASNNQTAAANSATAAANSATSAANSKSDSEAFAIGERNGQPVSTTDETYHNNSKYYAEVAQQAAAGGLIPQGTVTFANLPPITTAKVGDLWNISDSFTTTADFREGAGEYYGPGADVYKTADGYWDVLADVPQIMTGATASADGTAGECAAPQAGDQGKFWRGDATWAPLSYVGMVIQSTTLDTMQKVIDFYGGTTWILHDGYMLRGASTGVIANQTQNDGGQDTVTPIGTIDGGAVQSTTLTLNQIPSHYHVTALLYRDRPMVEDNGKGVSQLGYKPTVTEVTKPTMITTNAGGGQGHTHGFTQPTFTGDAHTNLPKYKNVYVWERTA